MHSPFVKGIDLDSIGPCDSPLKEPVFLDESGLVESEVIDEAVMTRFAEEDFRFVTKRTRYASEVDYLENITETDDYETDEMGGDRYFVRITSEGFEYASRYGLLNETTGPTSLYKGLTEGYEFFVKHRNLIVIGNDTRSAVPDTTAFPFRTIGSMDYLWGNNSCTATLISRKSALTAAHCVWNYAEAKPLPVTRLAPGRYFDSATNGHKEPFGMWEVDYTTSFGAYRDFRARTFDMAVVTYKPINRPDLGCGEVFVSCVRQRDTLVLSQIAGISPFRTTKKPGDIVGFVAIDSVVGTVNAVTDPRIANITITGYPYDFRRGEMTTSGPCDPPGK